jgi:hypothetical protein
VYMDSINPNDNSLENYKLRVNKIISRSLHEMEQARTRSKTKRNYTPKNTFICYRCSKKKNIIEKHLAERLAKSSIWYKILLCNSCLEKAKLHNNIKLL